MRFLLPAVLFFFLVIEGTWLQVFAPDFRGADWQYIPRFLFMLILFTGIYRAKSHGVFYAVIFGMMYDIVYAPVLGVYTFGFGFITYLFSISTPFMRRRPLYTALLVLVGVIALEYYVYGMMVLLGLTTLTHEMLFLQRFLPSFLLNGAAALAAAFPLRWWFNKVDGFNEE
ncbi:rod shape-determining protein MreD [Alkalicoccus urumqiensis]|uniref:Rod shape-determining protein MreD n=1 Tax=Alkalicoccus urumqiensis TaxID=1548213 RepID=A0A2P6MF47_ALKUR|nr:rod shape-determining protein MreD [Alkalicoccus urumqiensis]PRO64893.1 rod shape-determining protein MreD [Alkalicoccus urumqiensis]